MEKAKEMQFARRSFLLIAGSSVKIAVQLLVLYIFSRKLDFTDYGKYQSLWLYLNVLTVIGLFGLPAILLSTSYATIKEWIRLYFNRFILCAVALNFIPLIFILISSTDFSLPERTLICLLILSQTISIIAETLAIKNEREPKVLAVNIVYHLLFLALHLFIINKQPFSMMQLLMGLIVLNILKIIFLTAQHKKHTENNNTIENTGTQWLYLGLFDVTAVLFKWIDKWLILVFISIEQFALYYNGTYEIPVYAVLFTPVANIMLIEVSKLKQSDTTDIMALFRKSSLFLAAFIFPIFCMMFWFHKEIFLFIFSEKYAAAIPVFLVSIFVIPARITNYTAALQVFHKNDIILKGAVIDLFLAILLMAALYPLCGLPGMAAAFVISTFFQVFYYLWHTGKLLKLPVSRLLPWTQLVTVMICCFMVSGAFFFMIQSQSAIIMLITGISVCIASALLLVYRLYKIKML